MRSVVSLVFYGAPDNADWTDRAVWREANPALSGHDAFLSMAYLENEFTQAEAMPREQNSFRTYYLNQWVGQEDRFIDLQVWDASAGHPTTLADLDGRSGFGGMDLGAIGIYRRRDLVPCRGRLTLGRFLKCYLPEASSRSSA